MSIPLLETMIIQLLICSMSNMICAEHRPGLWLYTMLHPNVEKAHQVPLSLTNDNHVVAMRNELLFLKTISKYPKLFTPGPVLTNAIRR